MSFLEFLTAALAILCTVLTFLGLHVLGLVAVFIWAMYGLITLAEV